MEVDRLFVLMVAAVTLAAGQEPPPTPAAERPALSGRWSFDAAHSEDTREKLRAAIEARRGSVGEGRGGEGRGGWSRHRGGPRGGDRGQGGRGREGSQDRSRRDSPGPFEVPQELTITQTEPEIALLDKDGRLRLVHPDAKTYKAEAGQMEVKSWWDKDRLVVESKRGDRSKLTETFSLAVDPKRLLVDVSIESRFAGNVTIHRVYTPVEPAE